MRVFFAWLMSPLLRLMLRAGLPPNAITSVSVAFSLAAAVALAAGRFSLGGWLYFLAGACDFFDGRLARAQNRASPGGAALDSILDRYTEAAVLVGLAWYYQGTWVLFAVLLALVGSLLVPYVRARGEALQATMAEVGIFQRPERVVLLGTTVALSPILEVFLHSRKDHPMHWLAVAGIVAIAAGTQFTAFQRTRYLVRTLSDQERDSGVSPSKRAWMRAAVASFLATAVDAGLVALLAIKGDVALPIATGLGCLVGGITNFTLNRNWSFTGAASLSLSGQAARYAFVSLSSALFNAGGVAVMMLLPNIADPLAWLLVRAAVWAAWTYPMFRDYVFDAFRRPAAVEAPRTQREEPRTSVA
jgi:phosphatidylglycerophosphate synthase/putative flippase GtrA